MYFPRDLLDLWQMEPIEELGPHHMMEYVVYNLSVYRRKFSLKFNRLDESLISQKRHWRVQIRKLKTQIKELEAGYQELNPEAQNSMKPHVQIVKWKLESMEEQLSEMTTLPEQEVLTMIDEAFAFLIEAVEKMTNAFKLAFYLRKFGLDSESDSSEE